MPTLQCYRSSHLARKEEHIPKCPNINVLEACCFLLVVAVQRGNNRLNDLFIQSNIVCERSMCMHQSFPWMAQVECSIYLQQKSRCLRRTDARREAYQNPNIGQPDWNHDVCKLLLPRKTKSWVFIYCVSPFLIACLPRTDRTCFYWDIATHLDCCLVQTDTFPTRLHREHNVVT